MEQTGGQPGAGDGRYAGSLATAPEPSLRAEFGAHLEANYPRLVAQLCLITLDPAEAQDLVQESYARAWQRWSEIRQLPDPTGWVRQSAVRAGNRRWRRMMTTFGRGRSRPGTVPSEDPQHRVVLDALRHIPPHRRRVLVLADVAHLPLRQVAEVEGIAIEVAEARLGEARTELMNVLNAGPGTEPSAMTWEDM
ncbi:MAG TPA: sigma factor [Pseudonocardia sp.]|jgi:RNA polymerase sigma-70 factor (ECF subfamily)